MTRTKHKVRKKKNKVIDWLGIDMYLRLKRNNLENTFPIIIIKIYNKIKKLADAKKNALSINSSVFFWDSDFF